MTKKKKAAVQADTVTRYIVVSYEQDCVLVLTSAMPSGNGSLVNVDMLTTTAFDAALESGNPPFTVYTEEIHATEKIEFLQPYMPGITFQIEPIELPW